MRALVACLLLLSCRTVDVPKERGPAAIEDPRQRERLLDELELLITGSVGASPTAAKLRHEVRAGKMDLETFGDNLLDDPRFAHEIAPAMVLHAMVAQSDFSGEIAHRLHAIDRPAWLPELAFRPILFLKKPCTPDKAVSVQPWWDPSTRVLVCEDSYRPNVVKDSTSNEYCSGYDNRHGGHSDCGCGPFLINCTRDGRHRYELSQSLLDESKGTVAYVVEHDLPLASVFVANETFRDKNAESLYQRELYMAGRLTSLDDLASWPAGGAYRPRKTLDPGEHAGILTDTHISYFRDAAVRPRLKFYYDLLWCKEPSSVNVTPEQILKLKSVNLRDGDGWKQLAAMPICTDCHARLDYGMQFFSGHPNGELSFVYLSALHQNGRGPLYGDDINDKRGEAELTPQGFAQLATQQPEFTACMAQNVRDHVLGPAATAEDTHALEAAFRERGTMKAMMRVALRLYLRSLTESRAASRLAAASTSSPAPPAPEADRIALSPSLRKKVDRYCADCHSDGAFKFADQAVLPRLVVAKMLDRVGYGLMPKGSTLAVTERRDFTTELIDSLWADQASRNQAAAYYLGSEDAARSQRLRSALNAVRGLTGADGEAALFHDQPTPEEELNPSLERYNTGFAVAVALEALIGCKHVPKQELKACVARASEPRRFLRAHPGLSVDP